MRTDIKIKVVPTSKSLRARWDGRGIVVTVPPYCTQADIDRFLAKYADQIERLRPTEPRFADGMIIDGHPVDFTIDVADRPLARPIIINSKHTDALRGKRINYLIQLSPDVFSPDRLAETRMQAIINDAVLVCAHNAALLFLVPRAEQLARRIGFNAIEWKVGNAKKTLGSCTGRGSINLSSRLVFLPEELADFVVYHELAHLTHMNHSAAFHRLVDTYVGGREAELSAALRAFRFPVF